MEIYYSRLCTPNVVDIANSKKYSKDASAIVSVVDADGKFDAGHDSNGTVKGDSADVDNEISSLRKQNEGQLDKLEEVLNMGSTWRF